MVGKIISVIVTILIALLIISFVLLKIPDGAGLQTKALIVSILMLFIGTWGIIKLFKSF